MKARCRVCGHEADHTRYTIREMMFGSRDEFDYFWCGACACLQIGEIPDDLSKYYPPGYYAHDDAKHPGAIKRWRTRQRDRYALTGRGFIGRLIHRKHPDPRLASLRRLRMTRSMSICDVGCGRGALLNSLARLGFADLRGVDPFMDHDIKLASGVEVRKAHLRDLSERFDLIILNHSFEHMADPVEAMKTISERLSEDGTCLIRIPVVPSAAWDRYGVNWVQLDAPRHLHLHSVESMRLLASQSGMRIANVVYDSTRFQFVGSELYANDIPLRPSDEKTRRRARKVLTHRQKREFERRAIELNRSGRGDQAAFHLVRD